MSFESPSSAEQYTGKITFGDAGEFSFEQVVEEVDAETGVLSEVTVFFTSGGKSYGLSIETSETERVREADPSLDIPPAIETRYIDPQVVLRTLQLPSEAIRAVAVPADIE